MPTQPHGQVPQRRGKGWLSLDPRVCWAQTPDTALD
jgi:hypothetical protein